MVFETLKVSKEGAVLFAESADPDYFISHVDVTRIKEYRAEALKLTGEASIALLMWGPAETTMPYNSVLRSDHHSSRDRQTCRFGDVTPKI